MANEKAVKYDVDGYESVTAALLELLNKYPGLKEDDEISFSALDENSGIAMYSVQGAMIESEKKTITGKVTEVCLYPFYVIYRAAGLSEGRKAAVKEWLDNLGKWLERKEITVNGETFKLSEYPRLTGSRTFLSISRQTPAYLDTVNENKSENWAIYITARYQNEYKRNQ